ncbi:hypothetical protein EV401DRAFT_1893887 [Pisolithus croceorrhizus]|nr:hypothetical protein EV401DRAFT_1893887 [Pisolithus croceorrhizus]
MAHSSRDIISLSDNTPGDIPSHMGMTGQVKYITSLRCQGGIVVGGRGGSWVQQLVLQTPVKDLQEGRRGNSLVSGENTLGRLPPIQWDATRTELLISWLLNHAANRHILFHNKNTGGPLSALPAAPGDKLSGHNKKEWAVNSEKFQLSIMNCLVSLKDKYCEHVKSLNQMGAGVAPGASNLCEMIINMLSLVQGGATCPSDDLFTTNSGELAALQDDSATGDQGIGSTPWGEYDHGGMGDYDYSGMGEDDGQVGEHVGDYDFQDQAGGTSYRRDNDFGRMSYRRDDDIGGTFDDVEMYEGTENDTDATSADML